MDLRWLIIIFGIVVLSVFTYHDVIDRDLEVEKEMLKEEKEKLEQEQRRIEREALKIQKAKDKEQKRKYQAEIKRIEAERKREEKKLKQIQKDILRIKLEAKKSRQSQEKKPEIEYQEKRPTFNKTDYIAKAQSAVEQLLQINQELFVVNDRIKNYESLCALCNQGKVDDDIMKSVLANLEDLRNERQELLKNKDSFKQNLDMCNKILVENKVKAISIIYPETKKIVIMRDDTAIYARSLFMTKNKVTITDYTGQKYEKDRSEIDRIILPKRLNREKLLQGIINLLKPKYDEYVKSYESTRVTMLSHKKNIKSSCWYWRTVRVGENIRRVHTFNRTRYDNLCKSINYNAKKALDKEFEPYRKTKDGLLRALKTSDHKLMEEVAVFCARNMSKKH